MGLGSSDLFTLSLSLLRVSSDLVNLCNTDLRSDRSDWVKSQMKVTHEYFVYCILLSRTCIALCCMVLAIPQIFASKVLRAGCCQLSKSWFEEEEEKNQERVISYCIVWDCCMLLVIYILNFDWIQHQFKSRFRMSSRSHSIPPPSNGHERGNGMFPERGTTRTGSQHLSFRWIKEILTALTIREGVSR